MRVENFKYLIIGGGISGTTAAEKIRFLDPDSSIAIIDQENFPLYSRVMLPQYLEESLTREKVFLKHDSFYSENKITFLKGLVVKEVNTREKKVVFDSNEAHYEKLLIATGGRVKTLEVPGKEKKGIYYFRTLVESDQIFKRVKEVKNALVVGGGFIGLEFINVFFHYGLKMTCIVLEPYYWSNILDEISGLMIEKHLQEKGINFLFGEEVREFIGSEWVEKTLTKKGLEVPSEIVGIGIGIDLNTDFVKNTSLLINKGIVTNEYLETNVENVFAAGDVAEFKDVILEKTLVLGNWSNAAGMGRIAGFNMVGQRQKYQSVTNYSISCLGLNITFVGDVSKEGVEILSRGSIEEGSYERILLRNGVVVGATLINRKKDYPVIAEAIKNRLKSDELKI